MTNVAKRNQPETGVTDMRKPTTVALLLIALLAAATASAAERMITSQPVMYFGGTDAKAIGDTIDLMGPGGLYPYRGDFETASARPGGGGSLPDGWYSVDETSPANHWHVDTYGVVAPLVGKAAWCGDIGYASCDGGVTDPAGGYGNNWYDILEFRKTVRRRVDRAGAGRPAVRQRAGLRLSRTAAPYGGQPRLRAHLRTGLCRGTASARRPWTTRSRTPRPICMKATTLRSRSSSTPTVAGPTATACGRPTARPVWTTSRSTLNGGSRTPRTSKTARSAPTGPLPRTWAWATSRGSGAVLGDADDCASNYSKLVAFIDDGLVVPGTGGTVGGPGNDYGPPGGYIVNNTGGLSGPAVPPAEYDPLAGHGSWRVPQAA